MAALVHLVPLVARIFLVAMFPFSAADKIWHWRNSLAQTRTSGLPGGPLMLAAAIAVEAATPVAIVLNVYANAAAAVLAGFCVVTAILYHPFWRYSDFASSQDDSVAREHFWQFLKNFAIVGGLLLLIVAGSPDVEAGRRCDGGVRECLFSR